MLKKGIPTESDRKTKSLSHVGRVKDDLTSELRELGWSDMDLHNEDKKSSNLSLEGEFSSPIGEAFTKTGEQKDNKIDKSQVVALKKKNALMLKRKGWTEPKNASSKSQTFDKEELLSEIQSLKRKSLNRKRAGNVEEAMKFLKKAKLLERGLNNSGPEDYNTMSQKSTVVRKGVSFEIAGTRSDSIQLDKRNTSATNNVASRVAPKSRLMIQRELLSLKKKALTLRREGKMNEAEKEMQKGAALECQLMEMDKAMNVTISLIIFH
ncbi:hypothetical protein JHK82_055813 [Glycine max]|nr:hypothetical protein JHK85_056641 [Glycine max]KAG5077118.1 hypothetical protein JHK82_055813 [Glycine max]